MSKINFGGRKKDGHSKETDKTRVMKGTTEDLLKARQVEYEERIIPELDKLFENYAGGSICIVYNNYDENNNVTGNTTAVLGADDVLGLVKLSRAVHEASRKIIDSTVDNMSKQGSEGLKALLDVAMEISKEMLEEDDE